MARGSRDSGTSRMAIAPDIDQNPPSATPRITRAASSTGSDQAKAASRLDSTSRVISPHITSRRSMRLVTIASAGAAMAATTAVAVTVWPAAPSLMPRSADSFVSRLAGRNSVVTRPKTPSAIEKTAGHAGSVRSCGSAAARAAASAERIAVSLIGKLR